MANHGKSTHQVIFDRVTKHLRKQKRLSLRADGAQCMYRGAGGTKCAVGALISDKYYTPALEGIVTIDVLNAVRKSIRLPLEGNTKQLLRELQIEAHDQADEFIAGYTTSVWSSSKSEAGLAYVARKYDLVYTPPKTA